MMTAKSRHRWAAPAKSRGTAARPGPAASASPSAPVIAASAFVQSLPCLPVASSVTTASAGVDSSAPAAPASAPQKIVTPRDARGRSRAAGSSWKSACCADEYTSSFAVVKGSSRASKG